MHSDLLRISDCVGAWISAVLLFLLLVVSVEVKGQTDSAAAGKPTTKTDSCMTAACHVAIGQRKVMHGPVAQDKCAACHQYVKPAQHTFELTASGSQLCTTCHTLSLRNVVHKPVQQGRCIGCHDPHGSEHQMMLIADPVRGLCVSCHKQDNFAKKKYQHGPVAAGACILCHESHSSWEPNLLVEKPGKLCLTCHVKVLQVDSDQARHIHEPVKEDCAKCHDPHASDIKYQLREDTPDLCFSCHDDVKQNLAQAKVVHGAMTQPGGCLGCHAPHSSPLPKLQRTSQTKMCLSCHDREIATADGRTIIDMAALLAENPDHHGPIRADECSACHQPHAGDRHRMLIKEYPPEFYAPFEEERYALCFSCHRPELIKDKRGKGLTRFRNEDVNLHWLHVNRKKGRTCRACHEVHASKNPFHIRDAVPFGNKGWMLELRYQKTQTGGTCSPGCHETRSYDHGQRAPADKEKKTAVDKADVSKSTNDSGGQQ